MLLCTAGEKIYHIFKPAGQWKKRVDNMQTEIDELRSYTDWNRWNLNISAVPAFLFFGTFLFWITIQKLLVFARFYPFEWKKRWKLLVLIRITAQLD